MHGLASFHQDTRSGSEEALRLFGKAVELDPGFAAAYGMAALCYVGRNWEHWMLDPRAEVAEAAPDDVLWMWAVLRTSTVTPITQPHIPPPGALL